MRRAAQLLRAACIDLVGAPAFEQLYALMKANADAGGEEEGEGESLTELSRRVFRIIPYDKSEAVPLLYRLLYSEAQLEG
jgi:NIMA (never in mitosis gene a)-related kinase